MDIQFTNFATSTIADAAGIAAGTLTVNVAAGTGALFPALTGSKYFYCVLIDSSGNREIVKVTARATDTFTIVRAQEGTTARAFALDDKIELRVTKGSLEAMALEIGASVIPAGTIIAAFKQNAAPTSWTRDATPQDNAMLCVAATGNIGAGGAVNPQSAHTHTGPSHTHTGPSHTHTGPSHTHTVPSPGWGSRLTTAVGRLMTTWSVGLFSEATNNTMPTGAGGTGATGAGGDGATGAGGDDATGAGGDGATGAGGTGATGAGGTGATGGNSAPYYQEVICCTKDAY